LFKKPSKPSNGEKMDNVRVVMGDQEVAEVRPARGVGLQVVPILRTEYRQGGSLLLYRDLEAKAGGVEVVVEYGARWTRRQWLAVLQALLLEAEMTGEIDGGWTLTDLHHALDMAVTRPAQEPPNPF
jgi:hypothetical protein